jgi:predicted acylesterase/phospholipase RssA
MTRARTLLCLAIALSAAVGCGPSRFRSEPPVVYHAPAEAECEAGPRPAKTVLAVSGGGMYGAYAAGFLAGWTDTGTRPEFDVVTGVSTGALIGTCAFLGPEFDATARKFYTGVKATDIYAIKYWVSIPFSPAVASNQPLRNLIDQAVTPEVIAKVAVGHRAGRRLYIGTTHLEPRKLVTWDMGAIACRGTPESAELFRAILLASCSIPGILPPVPIEVVSADGKKKLEWHADGGVAAPLFLPPNQISPQATAAAGGTDVYIVVAGKFYPDPAPVKQRLLSVVGATVMTTMYSHCRSELASLYHLSRLAGAKYHVTALPQDFKTEGDSVSFDPVEMQKLFESGYRQGTGGPVWLPAPPTESAAGENPRL